MRSTTANYDTENALDAQDPVVLVQFDGVTREYSSDTFSGINTTNVKKYISSFMAKFSPINLLESFQELGQMIIKIVDKDQDVTSVLNSSTVFQKDVTVKLGFQGITEADFVSLPVQRIIDNPRIGSNMREWQFVTRDAQRLINGKIGRKIPTCSLDGDITDSQSLTSITVNDTTGFVDPTNLPAKNVVQRMHLKCNSEMLSYQTIGATSFGASGFIGRGVNFSNRSAQSDGDTISQVYHFSGMNPCEALLHILLTTDNGTGHAYYDLTRFDASFEGMGLGLSPGLVNIEVIERLGYKYFNSDLEDCGHLHIYQEEDAFEWIVENILIPGGLILIRDNNGLISLTSIDRLEFIDNFSSSADFDDDDIVLESYEIDFRNTINDIKFIYLTKGLTNNSEYESYNCLLPDSIVAYRQREKQHEIVSPLCSSASSHSGNSTPSESQIQTIARRWFHTFGNPLGYVTFIARQPLWLTEPTDNITLTLTEMPDTDDGGKGWSSKKFFVTGQEIGLNPAVYRYNALTWEAYTELDTFYDFTTVDTFDDNDIAYNADSSVTIDSEDGYYDLPGVVFLNGIALITLEITPPNSGGTEHWLDIDVHFILTSIPIIKATKTFKSIRYNSGDSTAFDIVLGCFFAPVQSTSNSFDRIKIDFYNTSAASAERPSSITWTELKYSTWQVDVESATNVTDTFTDTNGTAIGSHTTDTGQGWSVDSGAAEIQSNSLDVISATLVAYVSTSIGRYITQQVDVTVSTGTGWEVGIIFRRSDSSNYMKLTLDEATNTANIIKVEGGSPTTIKSSGMTVTTSTTYTLNINIWSQVLYCLVKEGTTIVANFSDSSTPSFNPDEGDHGIYSDTANAIFDDFSIISDS